jgi:hypothetical protein
VAPFRKLSVSLYVFVRRFNAHHTRAPCISCDLSAYWTGCLSYHMDCAMHFPLHSLACCAPSLPPFTEDALGSRPCLLYSSLCTLGWSCKIQQRLALADGPSI